MSKIRSASPTMGLWQGREQAREKMATMANMGLHVFDPDWQTWEDAPRGKMFSSSFKDTTMQIFGQEDKITFPVQTCTKVKDVKEALARALMIDPGEMEFIVKQGCNSRKQFDCEEVARRTVVKGITAFKSQPHKWPHPTGIIGTGYQGLKTAFLYVSTGNTNITLFDRHDKVGGYCWIDAANKSSRIQTEFGSFHVWGGQELLGKIGYPNPEEWGGIWPKKHDILRHFHYAAEQFGVLPHCNFSVNVAKLDIDGDKNSQNHSYKLTLMPVNGEGDEKQVHVSTLFNFPGSMTRNRIIEYPGEDVFTGLIGYGMNDGTPYDTLKGSCTAILGNGAFAVESIRTCCEYEAEKTYLITRRKNLACPRLASWFGHQGVVPTPARLILKLFEPMYEMCGFGDPWSFWSVHASSDRRNVTIIQNSRFGIGDVTFLALAYGKAEFIEDTLKRVGPDVLYLTTGRKLENVNNIIKSLGLLGDYAVDRLHRMTKMVGVFCDGDWRRVLMMDAPGMNAANFSTFSVLGSIGFSRSHKFLFDYPREFYKLQEMGLMGQLPVHKAEEKEEKPAYVYGVRHAMTAAITEESMCFKMQMLGAYDGEYKYKMYHAAHSLDYTIKECTKSWDEYQATWKAQGSTHDYVPFPYTREFMVGIFTEYCQHHGFPLSPDGPPPDQLAMSSEGNTGPTLGQPPGCVGDAGECERLISSTQPKEWWSSTSTQNCLFQRSSA